MDPREFALLLDRFALSAEGYRKVRKGVQKRIARHMQQLGCQYSFLMDNECEFTGYPEYCASELQAFDECAEQEEGI